MSANNIASGNIEYKWLSDSTYQFVCKLYIDCTGNDEPDSVIMCAENTCASNNFSTTLHKINGMLPLTADINGHIIPPGCSPHPPTKCSDTSSKLPGIREWWYIDTITIPARCNNWKFNVAVDGRVNNNNYYADTFYTEATLNNQISHQNSSTTNQLPAVIFGCLNQPYQYDLNLTDPDGDSLHYSLAWAKTSASTSCPYVDDSLQIAQSSPAINFTNNPFQTNQTFLLNNTTGTMNFTSGQVGSNLLALQIDEYRNGSKIGSIIKEISIQSLPCSTIVPNPSSTYASIDTNTVSGGKPTLLNNNIRTCINQKLYFEMVIGDSSNLSILTLSDDHSVSLPNANIYYTNQGSDSIRLHFEWTPTMADIGYNSFDLTITDTACRPPIGFLQYIHTIALYVPFPASAGNDTAICSHEPITLTGRAGYGPGSYIWEQLPGSTGSLSCDTCDTATATPSSTSKYALKSTVDWCTNVFHDTIEVSILNTPITYPTASITVQPDSNIWPGLNTTFNAVVSNCNNVSYQWQQNGNDIQGATNATWSSTTLKDDDVIRCEVSCGDTCPDPRQQFSNTIKMNVAVSVYNFSDENVSVYPNPNNGAFRLSINSTKPQAYELTIVNTLGKVIYNESIINDTDQLNKQIDLNDIPSGIYLLNVKTTENNLTQKLTIW